MAVLTYRVPLSTLDGNFAALIEADVTAATRTDGWTSAKLAAGNMSEFDAGTKQVSGSFSTGAKPASFLTGTTANAFKTPASLTGDFAAAAWTFTFALRCATASSQRGRMRMRVFKSVNADGSGATELTGATQIGTTVAAALSTTADQTSVVTWSPGAFSLADEYLFFVIAWEVTTAGGSNSADVLMRTGQSAGGSRFVTADFTSTLAPLDETVIDDFTRADNAVYIGGNTYPNARKWSNRQVDSTSNTNARVISNQLGETSAGLTSCCLWHPFQSSFDFLVDLPTVGTAGFAIWFCVDSAGGYQASGYEWDITLAGAHTLRNYVGGTNQGNLATASGIAPASGDSYWVAKRGNVITCYIRRASGAWVQVFRVTNTVHPSGTVAIEMNDTTIRFDNVRGGPLVVFSGPLTQISIDDFNRADGKVNAGAGAAFWEPYVVGGSTAPGEIADIISNQLGMAATSVTKQLSKFPLPSGDWDIVWDCVAVGGATLGKFEFLFELSEQDIATFDAFGIVWTGTSQVNCNSYSNGNFGANWGPSANEASPPAAGDTFWIEKRGPIVTLYRKPAAGAWGIITRGNVLSAGMYGERAGAWAFDPGTEVANRWDNFRGGPFVPAPTYTQVYDDFNRADGLVQAGAGSTLWDNNRLDYVEQTQASIYSNQMGIPSATWYQAVSKGTVADDFDLYFDRVVPVGAPNNEFAYWFCIQTAPGVAPTGFALVGDATGFAAIRNYVSGVNTSVIATTASGGVPAAGDVIWIARRGDVITYYLKRAGGYFTKILEGSSSLYKTPGLFAIEMSDTAVRYDNVGGGPFAGIGPAFSAADSVTTSDSLQLDQGFGLTLDVADSVTTSDNLVLADFTPLVITGCRLWLDASQIGQSPGTAVSPWLSLQTAVGVNGILLGSPAPVLRSAEQGINGLPVVRYTKGQGTHHAAATALGVDREFTVFIVARMWGATRLRLLAAVYSATGAPNVLVGWWDGKEDKLFVEGWASPDPTTPAGTNPKLYSADGSASSGNRLFRDGTLYSSTGVTPGGWKNTFHISPDGAGFTEGSDCEVGEVIFYDRKLADVERQQVEAYLRTKWITPGAALTITPADSVTVTDDSSALILDLVIPAADSVTVSDAPTVSLDVILTAADSVAVSDGPLDLVNVIPLDLADSVTVSDQALIATSGERPQFSFAYSAAYELQGVIGSAVSQEIGGGGKSVVISKSGGGVEVVGGGAHPTFTTDWTISAADSVLATDGLALAEDYVQSDADTVTTSDLDSWVENYAVTFTPDSVTTSDSLQIDVSLELAAADSVTTSDLLTRQQDFVLDLADSVTASDSLVSTDFGLGADDTVTVSDLPNFVQDFVHTVADSVAVSDLPDFAEDYVLSFADTVTTSDLGDLSIVIPKAGGAVEGSSTGLAKLVKVAQSGGGIEQAVGGAVWASKASKSGGGIEGGSAGGTAVKAFLVAKSGGATSAEVGGGSGNLTVVVSKAGGAVEGSIGGISAPEFQLAKSGGGISAESGAFMVGTVKVGGAQSPESGGISKLVQAVKQGQGVEGSTAGGAVSTLAIVKKTGGATEGSVAGGAVLLTLVIPKAGGAAEPQTAGASRAHSLVKSLGGISNEQAAGARSFLALKSAGGISAESGSALRTTLIVVTKQGGGIEILFGGVQKSSIHRLVGGGTVSEVGGGPSGLARAVKGGATSAEIGGLSKQTFYVKRLGGISPEIGGGYGRRIKTFQEGGAESPESGGGKLNYTIAIPPGEGQPGELVGSEFVATLVGASSDSSTGQLVGATSGAMVLSGIEKAILVAAQEEVTFE